MIFKGYVEELESTKHIEADTYLCGLSCKYTQILQRVQITGSKKTRDIFNKVWFAFPFKKSVVPGYKRREVWWNAVWWEKTQQDYG